VSQPRFPEVESSFVPDTIRRGDRDKEVGGGARVVGGASQTVRVSASLGARQVAVERERPDY
jgi:hypothetical protein